MTVRTLNLHSERYGSTGNIGENFKRLLGAPTLDSLQTIIREAIQNIADAARLETGPEILIRLRKLSPDQKRTLAFRIIRKLPQGPSYELLSTTLSHRELTVMEICDFGTIGLGGPTRSDCIPEGEVYTDFIDFLRNIGTPRDTELGGGTYGFGKAALYRASRCSTIIVDTLPHETGPEGRRLMGCHIGPSFEVSENGMRRRYTGRHWWGVDDSGDGIIDPVTGDAVRYLAAGLGFPDRSTDRSGTSIMILDFDTENESLDQVGRMVVQGLLWNFWPRMMRDTPVDKRFTCAVEVNGSSLTIPFPEDFPPLDLFSKAMRAIRNGTGKHVRKITSERPAKELGTLAIEKGLCTPRHLLMDQNYLFPRVASHIALMRPVELVVKYLEGTPLPDSRVEWAGVFVSSHEDKVERAFADSEPPAHDDWIPNSLMDRHGKTYVNVALRKLKAVASEIGSEATGQLTAFEDGPPLARLAGQLGAVLEGVVGDGAGKGRGKGRGGKKRLSRPKASRPVFDQLELTEKGTVAIFSTEISQDPLRKGSVLVAYAAVVIEGLGTSRVDADIQQPVVLSIQSHNGRLSTNNSQLILDGREGKFLIRVLVPKDCAVTVDAEVLSATSS